MSDVIKNYYLIFITIVFDSVV